MAGAGFADLLGRRRVFVFGLELFTVGSLLYAIASSPDALALSKYAEGVPYRVRADYLRGKDTSNLDDDSSFLHYMVKP